MAMIPPAIIVVWLCGLLSLGLVAGGAPARRRTQAELAPLAPARHMGLMEHNQQFAALVDTFATSVFEAMRPLDQTALGS